MTTREMITLVDRFLDSRNLADPSIRKRAIRKVAAFIESTKTYLDGNQLALPSDKNAFKAAYERYKGGDMSGAESSAINHMYDLVPDCVGKVSIRPASASKSVKVQPKIENVPEEFKAAEKALIGGDFVSANTLDDYTVPDVPGLYCIKLRKGVVLPAKYGKIREDGIIYIGQASTSLRQRFWRQELNHHGAATFFRGIGAVLGYLPPKGSLYGKSTNNYKFSDEDTEAIRKWIRQSLFVNWIPFGTDNMDTVERELIQKYRPLMNTTHNPTPSPELAAARERCREYARSK